MKKPEVKKIMWISCELVLVSDFFRLHKIYILGKLKEKFRESITDITAPASVLQYSSFDTFISILINIPEKLYFLSRF